MISRQHGSGKRKLIPGMRIPRKFWPRQKRSRSKETATFNVNNAFHYNYVELIANMAPPRTYVLSLEAKF